LRLRRQSRPRDRRILGAALEIPGDLRRALRSPGAVALGDRRSAAWPLENLRHRPARRRPAQGLLRQRAALSAGGASVAGAATRRAAQSTLNDARGETNGIFALA